MPFPIYVEVIPKPKRKLTLRIFTILCIASFLGGVFTAFAVNQLIGTPTPITIHPKPATDITIQPSITEGTSGDSVTLTAVLNQPNSNIPVDFYYSTTQSPLEDILIGTSTTDNTGTATYGWQLPTVSEDTTIYVYPKCTIP